MLFLEEHHKASQANFNFNEMKIHQHTKRKSIQEEKRISFV